MPGPLFDVGLWNKARAKHAVWYRQLASLVNVDNTQSVKVEWMEISNFNKCVCVGVEYVSNSFKMKKCILVFG